MPSLMATLGLNASSFVYELNSAQGKAQSAGSKIGSSLGNAVKGQLAGLFSTAAIGDAIRRTVQYADKIDDMSVRLGIGAEALQRWDYALGQTGSNVDVASKFFEKLAMSRKDALEGKPEQLEAFQRLGVTLDDLKNKRLEDIGMQIGAAFQAGDPQALIADLREVGGRSAGELVAAFRIGLGDLMGEASVMSDDVAAKLGEIPDRMLAAWTELRSAIAPILVGISDLMLEMWRSGQSRVEGIVGAAQAAMSFSNPIAGYNNAQAEYAQKISDEENARKARREALKGAQLGGLSDVDNKAEEKERIKAEAAAKRAAEKEERERVAAEAKAAREKEKQERDAARAEKSDAKATQKGFFQPDLNSLQRIGAYSQASEVVIAQRQREQSNTLLKEINQGIKQLKTNSSDGTVF